MSTAPVFFDPSGNRVVWLRRTGLFLGTLITVAATLFVLSLLAVPFLNTGGESATARLRHWLPSVPKRQQRMSLLLLNRERGDLWREIDKEQHKAVAPLASSKDQPVVAAFYAPWQATGLQSLRVQAPHLTHIMPIWLELDPTGRKLDFRDFDLTTNPSNKEVISLAKANGVAIVPLISNAQGDFFDPVRVQKLLDSPAAQTELISRLSTWLQTNHFAGLNLDWENLRPQDYTRLPGFIKALGTQLHQQGMTLSVDLEANLPDKDMKALTAPSDFAVLMAYNEHYPGGDPGPIASWPWTVKLTTRVAKLIPANKLVLGIGNYGYDWSEGNKTPAESLTYQSAILAARDSTEGISPKKAIDFDPQSLNATFDYEEDGKQHEVWMLDAASAYNQWLLSQRMELRGSSLWVLGSEDPTLWSFFRREGDANFKSSQLDTLKFPYEVVFQGNGEILKVASSPQDGERTVEVDPNSGLCTDVEYQRFPSSYVIQRSGFSRKNLALTFDDGPDPEWTPQILNVLHENNVKGAFFLIGNNAEHNPALVKQLWEDGHDIGNHSFTHANLGIVSPRRVDLEINATQRAIESITGHSTSLFRPPYNADAEPQTAEQVRPVIQASKMGYLTIGEYIDPNDWDPNKLDAHSQVVPRTTKDIVNDIMRGAAQGKGNIILLHDAGGDRRKTVEALEEIIPALKEQGYHFVTVSQLLGKPRTAVMPALSGRQVLVAGFDRKVFDVVFGLEWLLSIGFIAAIALGIARVGTVLPLALWGHRRETRQEFDPQYQPRVSVLIAAYNEAAVINKTITSVLESDYPDIEVIVIDDGSKDGTADAVRSSFGQNPRVRLFTQENGGKATALNRGLAAASGEIYVGFDADTVVAPDAIRLLVRHFNDEKVAAVAGNVKVGNRLNLLTRWQAVEYVTSQNLDRRAQSLFNCITVVPGAIGAWRKSAVQAVGGYLPDTLAEDMDLTWRLRQAGWRIINEDTAQAYTEAPDSLKSLTKQRYRWAFGTLQCLSKHRQAIGKFSWFGLVALPWIAVFQFGLQWLAPCVDLQLAVAVLNAVTSIWHGTDTTGYQVDPLALLFLQKTAFYYALFFAIELAAAFTAVRLDREKPSLLWWLFWQRFVYRQMLYYVVLKATWTALTGYRQGWGKLARKGTVSANPVG